LLPALYQEDPATMRWTEGLDDVLAPLICTLDCLGAYIDPLLAPGDFVQWLAGWFGTVLDENWPLRRQRLAVARSVALYRQSGTVAGLRAMVELATDAEVGVTDSGGVSWSRQPNGPLPGREEASVVVRVMAHPGLPADLKAIDNLVAAAKPAHVTHLVEVIEE
jgi:phage tail-like protein